MSDTRFGIYPATLKPDSTPSNNINISQIDEDNFATGGTKALYRPGGSLDLSTVGLAFADPVFQFGSCDCDTILDAISPTVGLALTEGGVFVRQKRADESTFVAAATAQHIVYTSTNAFAALNSFEVNQDDDAGAKVMVSVFPLSSDGLTPPVAKAAGAINTYPTPAYNSRFFMGRVDVNSVELGGITGYSIDYGMNYDLKRFGGDVFPVCGAITFRNPTVRINTVSGDLDTSLNVFLNQVAGTMELYAYKEDTSTNNGRLSLATAEHIKHTLDGEWSMDEDSVSKEDDASYTFSVNVTGTVTVSTTSAAA